MTTRSGVWLFFLLAGCLLQSTIAHGQIIADVEGPNVSEENGVFTYEYTISNSFLSSEAINIVLFSVASGTDVVLENGLTWPAGWAGSYDPLLPSGSQASTEQVGFITGDGLTCGVAANAINIGESGTFVIQSRYGPGERRFSDEGPSLDSYTVGTLTPGCEFAQIESGVVEVPWIPPVPTGPNCDFDGDGDCDLVDIDSLGVTIAGGTNPPQFDLTGDSLVNLDDLNAFLADERVNKLNGDADFNGTVAFPDFLILSTNFGGQGVWSAGNFVPDNGDIGFSDFLVLSTNFNQSAAQLATASVPEPASLSIAGIAVICLAIGRRRRVRQ